MASERKYKCPFCNKTYSRTKLATHIDRVHEDMLNIDKGYTANRIVFDLCNKKEPIGASHGICRICKQPTGWDEENIRYELYCSPKCKDIFINDMRKGMIKVYGKPTLLNDTEHQKKMLSRRSISGKYRWSDGTYKTYTGTYELEFLKFCDEVLNIKSDDLITPGPTVVYEYDGKEHTWITDAMIIPMNLVLDIKDGGNNPNTRDMPEYRAKQVQKEKFLTDQGEYNYLRLTNNEFVQLLTIMAEIKESYMDENAPRTVVRVHEHTAPAGAGAIPTATDMQQPSTLFISNIMNKNTFETSFAISNDITSDYMITRDKNTGKLKKKKTDKLMRECKVISTFKYLGDDVSLLLREMYSIYKHDEYTDPQYLPCLLTEFDQVLTPDQLEYSNRLQLVDEEYLQESHNSVIATLHYQSQAILENTKPIVFQVLEPVKYEYKKELLREYKNLEVLQSLDGKYFAYNTLNCKRTKGVDSIYEINENMLRSISSTITVHY